MYTQDEERGGWLALSVHNVCTTWFCRCYPGVGDLEASDDEDAVLLENPAYENFMHKGLKVGHFRHGPCALVPVPNQDTLAWCFHSYTNCKQAQLMNTDAPGHDTSLSRAFFACIC